MRPRHFRQKFLIMAMIADDSGPGLNRAFGQSQARIRNNQLRINFQSNAEAGTARTGAIRAVKTKTPRLNRVKSLAALPTKRVSGKNIILAFRLIADNRIAV